MAQRQQTDTVAIPAPRGRILDAAGTPLAGNVEYVTMGLAPREVRDRQALAAVLRSLRLPRAVVRQATDPGRVWLHVPGLFPHEAVADLRIETTGRQVRAVAADVQQRLGQRVAKPRPA